MNRILFLLFLSASAFAQDERLIYPLAVPDSSKDTYFGTTVRDPFRWLENDGLKTTKRWISKETELSEDYLNGLKKKYNPGEQLIHNSANYFGTISKSGNYYFDMFADDQEHEPALYIKKKIDDGGVKVVDPKDYAAGGKDKAKITGYAVSEDNKYLAFSLSRNGSDWMEIRVKHLYPFDDEPDVVTGVKFSGIGWQNNGFYYVRYPQEGNTLKDAIKTPSICYHKSGTRQGDDMIIYSNPAKSNTLLSFQLLKHKDCLVIYDFCNDSGREQKTVLTIDLRHPKDFKADTLMTTKQEISFGVIGMLNGKFLVYTTLGAPGGKLQLLDQQTGKATDIVPENKLALRRATLIGNKIICTYLDDIDYTVITYDGTGKAINKIAFPTGSSAAGFGDNYTDSTTIFWSYSFLHLPIVFEYNLNTLKATVIDKTHVAFDYRDFTAEKVYYPSKDGTRIPMIVAYKKGTKRDTTTPALLFGNGGYGIAMTPFFDEGFISFMQNGGLVAIPCLRGGGEYGEEWHKKGSMFNKQNTFDDFIAAADFLVCDEYTSHENLAIMGGSNGGLLVAAVLNQRPGICRAAIAVKGVYDMLRYQKFTIGKAWETEYGSSADSSQFRNLYKYSPLHNIRDTVYPAILIVTADHDDRVVPLHSYKYAATLQKKKRNKADKPMLLYVEKNNGHHGIDKDTNVYIYSFIYEQLGIPPKRIHSLYY